MLLIFLPMLLFWESLTTSLREIRKNLRRILLTSTLLVVATAFAVAGIARALGMPWNAALILGAAVAPTDATAVGALARSMPRRNMTLLRAESLINDGTALVIYAIAVSITVGNSAYSVASITGLVALSYLGGAAAGALVTWLASLIIKQITDSTLGNVALLLTPFAAFLLAELIGASGVIAVVVAGLAMSQIGPKVSGAQLRRQSESFWSLSTYLLGRAAAPRPGHHRRHRTAPTADPAGHRGGPTDPYRSTWVRPRSSTPPRWRQRGRSGGRGVISSPRLTAEKTRPSCGRDALP